MKKTEMKKTNVPNNHFEQKIKMEFTGLEDLARNVLKVVDRGLVAGLGSPEPGKLCVEEAVCYAAGEEHSDEPTCVNDKVRSFKIQINDYPWSTTKARAKGLRRIAVAQLGSKADLDENKFERILDQEIRSRFLLEWMKTSPRYAEFPRKVRKYMAVSFGRYPPSTLCQNIDGLTMTTSEMLSNFLRCTCVHPGNLEGLETSIMRDMLDMSDESDTFDNDMDLPEFFEMALSTSFEAFKMAGVRRAKLDKLLSILADCCETALVECNSPGARYLHLTEKKPVSRT